MKKDNTQKPQEGTRFPVLFPATLLMALTMLFPMASFAQAGGEVYIRPGAAEQVPSTQQVKEYKRKAAKAKQQKATKHSRSVANQNVSVTILNLLKCDGCSKAKVNRQLQKLNKMLVQRQRDYKWLYNLYKRLNRRMTAMGNVDHTRCNDGATNNNRLLVLLGQLIQQMKTQNDNNGNNGGRLSMAQLSNGNTSNVTNSWHFLLNLRVEVYAIIGVLFLGLLGMFRLNWRKWKLILSLKRDMEGHEEQIKTMQRQVDTAKRNEKTALDKLEAYERDLDHEQALRSKDAEIAELQQQLERSDDKQEIAVLTERVSHLTPKSPATPEQSERTLAPANTERWFTQTPLNVNVNVGGNDSKANGTTDKPMIIPASK